MFLSCLSRAIQYPSSQRVSDSRVQLVLLPWLSVALNTFSKERHRSLFGDEVALHASQHVHAPTSSIRCLVLQAKPEVAQVYIYIYVACCFAFAILPGSNRVSLWQGPLIGRLFVYFDAQQ